MPRPLRSVRSDSPSSPPHPIQGPRQAARPAAAVGLPPRKRASTLDSNVCAGKCPRFGLGGGGGVRHRFRSDLRGPRVEATEQEPTANEKRQKEES